MVKKISKKQKVIIVLSNTVTANGKLSEESKLRVQMGKQLFDSNRASFVIMNGGPSKVDDGTYIQRGKRPYHCDIMRDYAISLGMPAEKVLVQDYSSDTVGEIYFVRRMLLEPYHWNDVTIVTSDYHLSRVRTICDILLKDISVDFCGIETNNNQEVNERRSLETFLKQFGDINKGDLCKFEQRLYALHELYSQIPSKERMTF